MYRPKKAIHLHSYKELVLQYQIFGLTADDIQLVGGIPERRREFLNYLILFQDTSFLQMLKRYRRVLEQRNSIMRQHMYTVKKNFIDKSLVNLYKYPICLDITERIY